jgi:HK97 gp10 family phage protein
MAKQGSTPNGIKYSIEIDENAILRLAGGPDVARALAIVGQEGERVAKENVPVDTGNLRRSITYQLGQNSPTEQWVRIGTNVEYGIFQEIGTVRHPAQPFLRPALEHIRRFLKG